MVYRGRGLGAMVRAVRAEDSLGRPEQGRSLVCYDMYDLYDSAIRMKK
jgi:hypothetical protein